MTHSIFSETLREVVETLQQELAGEMVAIYGRQQEPAEYLVVLFDTNLTHLEHLRALYQRLKPMGEFHLLAYSDLLNQISSQSMQIVGYAYQMQLLWGQDVLADHVIGLSHLSDSLERGLHQELNQLRREFLDAPVPLAVEKVLFNSWLRFENQLLPGLMLISGVLTPPPPLWENLARAFSLPQEQVFQQLKRLSQTGVAEQQNLWQLCLAWEEALNTLIYQSYKFAGHLQDKEVPLSQIAGLGALLRQPSQLVCSAEESPENRSLF